jgi:hypothetical protein
MRRLAVALVVFAAPAAAADAKDTAYGRIDGDLAVVLGAGATLGPRAPRATLDARFRYIQTAGVFFTYEDGPIWASSAEPRRAFATGIELRPLFLARWLRGLESGEPRLDLTIDSLALELGAVFSQPEGKSFGSRPGLQAGLGLEVPIFAKASGLFLGLHGGARWSDASLSGGPSQGASDRSLYLAVTLSWQQIFGGHVVELGDRGK